MRVNVPCLIAKAGLRKVSPRLERVGDEHLALLGARRFMLDRLQHEGVNRLIRVCHDRSDPLP